MPKARLTYKLPEERLEHELAVRSMEMYGIIDDIDQSFRSYLKHGEPSEATARKLIEDARQMFSIIQEWAQ